MMSKAGALKNVLRNKRVMQLFLFFLPALFHVDLGVIHKTRARLVTKRVGLLYEKKLIFVVEICIGPIGGKWGQKRDQLEKQTKIMVGFIFTSTIML